MKLRNIFLLVGVIGLLVVILLNLHQFKSFYLNLRHLRIEFLLLIVVVQLFSYYINALYYLSIIHIFGYSEKIQRLFEAALAANFVNYIIPTAGLAGAGFLSQALKPNVPRGEGVLTQLTRYTFSALAVLIMIPVGFYLAVAGKKVSASFGEQAIISSVAILLVVLIIVAFINNEKYLRKILLSINKFTARKIKRLKRLSFKPTIDDFYRGFRKITSRKRRLVLPTIISIVYIIVEMLTLYIVFLAFGKQINPGIVIMGYIVANISSIIGGTFISTGVFELGMIGAFVALGMSFAFALSVSIVYRIVNLLVGLPPGFYYYRKYLAASINKK